MGRHHEVSIVLLSPLGRVGILQIVGSAAKNVLFVYDIHLYEDLETWNGFITVRISRASIRLSFRFIGAFPIEPMREFGFISFRKVEERIEKAKTLLKRVAEMVWVCE